MRDAEALLEAGQEEVKRQYKKGQHNLRRALEDFFYRETRLRPVVLPQFIYV